MSGTSGDDPFTLFSDTRRRRVLAAVASHPGPVSLSTLAERLSDREDVDSTDSDGAVVARLHHVDLPKLDDFGVLTYDSDRRLVWYDAAALEAAVDDVETALESIRSVC